MMVVVGICGGRDIYQAGGRRRQKKVAESDTASFWLGLRPVGCTETPLAFG
ncbi:unnamed protein product [Linum tenue]|uniref:Uncharacterized protein n=1 Tax=Linum tenue TaxID=586396 RepID=A0AAV0RBV9_9ROSI|nr:unnamed protein product [Linum tenue]CAI0554152.1 unnamed protein product [Linum tenue]